MKSKPLLVPSVGLASAALLAASATGCVSAPPCTCQCQCPPAVPPTPSAVASAAACPHAAPAKSASPARSGAWPVLPAVEERNVVEAVPEKGRLVRVKGLRARAPWSLECGPAEAEVIDADSTESRLVVSAPCRAAGGDPKMQFTRFAFVATPARLPGDAPVVQLVLSLASRGEWKADAASVHVTQFENEGGSVAGSFEAVMSGRLNEDPVTVHGQFRALRGHDRSSP